VTETLESWVKRLGSWTLPSRAALLTGTLALFYALVAPLAWWLHGSLGLIAASLATAVCLVACWLALVVTELLSESRQASVPLLVGMLIRMSLPLLTCLLVTRRQPQLTEAGFAWYLIGAFLIGLLLETVLVVGQLKAFDGKQIETHELG
jgi:hypothetical protein